MDIDFIVKSIEAQGFVVALLCALLWFAVKIIGKQQEKIYTMYKENFQIQIDALNANTQAWKRVEEKLNVSNH